VIEMEDLKPCPFCGADAHRMLGLPSQPDEAGCPTKSCPLWIGEWACYVPQWNTRSPSPDLTAELKSEQDMRVQITENYFAVERQLSTSNERVKVLEKCLREIYADHAIEPEEQTVRRFRGIALRALKDGGK